MHTGSLPRHRNRMWQRTESTGGGGGTPPGGPVVGGGGNSTTTAPVGQSEGGDEGESDKFEPITSKADFEERIKRRIGQVHRQYADYDGLKEKAAQFDELLATTQSEYEQGVDLARAEGFNEAMSKTVPNLVKVAFTAEAVSQGVPKAKVEALLEDLDHVKYATDDGEPDWEKIAKKIKTVFGEKQENHSRSRDFGQGAHTGGGQTQKGEAGAAQARARFPQQYAGSGKTG
jgi:hypothetical protein